jgi:hypothetical protein
VVWGHPEPTHPPPTPVKVVHERPTLMKKKKKKREKKKKKKEEEGAMEIRRRRVGHNFLACPPARRSHNLPPDLVRGGSVSLAENRVARPGR